jgi:tRNA(fMet)-specific endonuclease VapC
MKRLLDTNAYVAFKRGSPAVAEFIRSSEQLVMSLVVLGELYFGFHDGGRFDKNVAELDSLLEHPDVSIASLTRATVDRFGRISAALKRQGTPIPTNDIWIAAQAMELGLELVTFDEHFQHVPGIVVAIPQE